MSVELDKRVFDAAGLPTENRVSGVRLIIMRKDIAEAVNKADDGADHDRMNRSIDAIIAKACYTAPEIRSETCWVPLISLLLTDKLADVARSAMEASP